ncbi:cyclic AMP-responsive element-binding protein 3-like protein 3-A [Thalassophryne amazonica]|uniref:cyclic AMP-responsive element-binding protein 3-like protein 3-A n=1 Tax=Thalassophryne amazonica TaxID=390379 RepID=UPI00147108D1|nr:cyclic AMP-responsive element-binding protein 3-like protein 3-A [Thalassophryne amazonica]
MDHYWDQGCDGTELLDWLFDRNNGKFHHELTGRHGSDHTWPTQEPNMLQAPEQPDDDFLNVLLSGRDSVPGSPLWSPSPSDSGISEDPPSDQMDSPQRPGSPPAEAQYFGSKMQTNASLQTNVSMNHNGWKPGPQAGRMKMTHPSDEHGSQLSSGFPLTVKDLLLSGTSEPLPHSSHHSSQELILNEDEKKLLAKEGVTLPSHLPLTKCEERILKKIRRKIRNKQSAQESRKKKKEYIDGLESRMVACSAHNQELQRKVSQLEKCNMSLMEQLRRLQALVMNTSNKPVQAGTCAMVLVLSFALILFPSLKLCSDTKVSQEDFRPVRIQSRSLQNLQASRVLHIADHPFSADDEADTLHQHLAGDVSLEDITTLMGKLEVNQAHSTLMPPSLNSSQEEGIHHFHVDPITGYIAAVTLNPRHPARLQPHADEM